MRTLSPRMLAALAVERGGEFDPALTLRLTPLAEDLALLGGARPLVCRPSAAERYRWSARARYEKRPAQASDPSIGAVYAGAPARRPL